MSWFFLFLYGMSKILEGLFDEYGPSKKEIKTVIKKKKSGRTICYVLLTCSEPNKDGTMEVEMQYEGEPWLASYLIKSAEGAI